MAVALALGATSVIVGCGGSDPATSADERASGAVTLTPVRDLPLAGVAPATMAAADPRRSAGARDEGFVGEASCATCHADAAERYRGTAHGRSLAVLGPDAASGRGVGGSGETTQWSAGSDWVASPVDGLRYRIETTDAAQHVQIQQLVDRRGSVLHEVARTAVHVIGSGNQTRSFLMADQGRITQMPLTWYSQTAHWDMSPGYTEANDRFSRPIIGQCLACHADRPQKVEHTQNVFEAVPGAISCERCHGPGRAHVTRWSAGGESVPEDGAAIRSAIRSEAGENTAVGDTTIVNPARLSPAQQQAVCAQCHLAGVIVYPDGEDPLTFRPGMQLWENRSVFVPALQLQDPDWVGIDSHPIRLARSACFDSGEMTCSSCHLPHSPADAVPEGHYRESCLSCHGGIDESGDTSSESTILCSRAEAKTPDEARSGDCVSCHMSAGGTSDVPHVRFTDHWIQRIPGAPLAPEAGRAVIDEPDPLAFVEVDASGRLAPSGRRSAQLDAALQADALFHFYETMHRRPGYLPRVIAAGRAGQSGAAGSPVVASAGGQLALARALLELDSVAAAEAVLAAAIGARPDDPWAELLLGSLLDERRGRPADALAHFDRALALQPMLVEARVERAEVLHALGRRADAARDLERVVADEPLHRARAWYNLGVLRLETGDSLGARAAFAGAADADPLDADAAIQLGSLDLARGDAAEAERAFRRAIMGAPRSAAAHGSLALALGAQGRFDEARDELRTVLQLEPGNAAARQLLQQLGG
jgi:tetratricopeptide (TPR) repeat protein